MSYQSVVLAKNPVVFWRLDELTGSVMVDLSGNENHGTYFNVASNPTVKGILSPIETDAASRAVAGPVGRLQAASGSALDFRAASTWECWGYNYDKTATTMICRNGEWSLNGSNIFGFNDRHAHARIAVGGAPDTFDLTYSDTLINTWYHMVRTRNGTVMRLYVNGILVAERTDLPSGDLVFENYNNGDYRVGVGYEFLGAWSAQGTDEVALYDYALTASEVLENYEAAKAVLPLRATIIINLSADLNTDQVTPTNLGFAHNFSETFGDSQIPITEELAYQTNVNQSQPDYQQRVSARPHGAYRTLEYHLSPSSGAGRSRLHGALYTPAQTYCVPVWTDSGVTTAQADSATDEIPCDTTKRDYEALSYCGACTDPQDPTTYQFFQILSVADAVLTLVSAIGTTIPSGSIVFPARLASISDDSLAVKSFAADQEDTMLRFELLETELSTRRITSYTPSTTYLSTEVFSLELAKVQFLDSRPYEISRRIQARGRDYQYAVDTGSPQTFPVRFLLTSRDALSEFYGWLDARQGKLNPLWVSSQESDLTVTARPTSTTLTVSPKTGFTFHHGRRHIEFLLTDGTFSRHRVTSITDNGTTETWAFAASLPQLADISRASFLKYCTLASDTISIRYFKGGANGAVIGECGLSFRELLTSPE